MECGLVSVSFREHSVEEIIAAAKAAHLSCIEWGSDVHAPCDEPETLSKIARLCKEAGLLISSYGTYFRIGKDLISDLQKYVNAAKILGTDILRVWCGTKDYPEYTEEEFSDFVETCKEAARIAESHGVTLCMECHRKSVTESIDGALQLMKAVHSEHFKMYWQPNQYRTVEENLDYATRISAYVTHIHVFNWYEKEKYPLSEAIDAWKKYLSAFSGEHTLLLEFMPDGRMESLPREAEALFEIIKG